MTDAQIRIADLPADKPFSFSLVPDSGERDRIATLLGIRSVRKARLEGQLSPLGRRDWRLEAHLGATVVQSCVVTLAPVTTRIEEDVLRTYRAEMPELPGAGEVEMPEDDSEEELPRILDLFDVLTEALSLALPQYPRAAGVAFADTTVTEPGKAPLTDEDVKPFAGLGALRDSLEKDRD